MEEGRVRVLSRRIGLRGWEGLCAAELVRGEPGVWAPVRRHSWGPCEEEEFQSGPWVSEGKRC